MTAKLFFGTLLKLLAGIVLVGLLVFLPAGTLLFPGGLLLMGVLFVPMTVAGVVLMIARPELLLRRLKGKEKEKTQDLVVKLSGLMFVVGFVAAGLTYRFGLYTLPFGVSVGGAVVFLLGYLLYAEVMRENTYLSRTIEVEAGQRVVDTGLYGVVRHPMYLATLILFLSMPIVLGSLWALPIFCFYPVLIVKRIGNEEEVLLRELDGYAEYRMRVRYRLIPFVW